MKESKVDRSVREDIEANEGWLIKDQANIYQRKGIPDLIICTPALKGRLLGIETKAGNGHPLTMAQMFEGYKITIAGGMYIVAYSDYKSFTELTPNKITLSTSAKKAKSALGLSKSDYEKLESIWKKINTEKKTVAFSL